MRPVQAIALLLAGCTASAPSEATVPQQAEEAHESVFGTRPDEARPITPLAAIVEAPERYRDQIVRTEGEVARVCQRMGCWMELRDGDSPAVRVPMAGHSFFLPRDSAGRHATLEGRVEIAELSEGHRRHLEEEGAQATASALAIHATGVILR